MTIDRDITEIREALALCWIIAQRNGFSDLIKALDNAILQAQIAADRILSPPSIAPENS